MSEERYLEDRIGHVERNFAALATDMGGLVRRTARLRDKGDKVVKTFQDFASNENGCMKKSLEGLADCCSMLEDCSQLKVCSHRLECSKFMYSLSPFQHSRLHAFKLYINFNICHVQLLHVHVSTCKLMGRTLCAIFL